jgi:integrase
VTKVEKTKKINKDKTKNLNNLIFDGINEIIGNEDKENKLKELMEKFDVETKKIIHNQDLEDISLSVKYLLIDSLYLITQNEKYNVEPFYNSQIKLLFLNHYPSNTQIPYARIFEISKEYEEKHNKDLSDFEMSQIEELLHALKPLTESASHVNGRIVSKYIDWCIQHDKTTVTENKLAKEDISYFKKFVDEEIVLYLTKEEIDNRILKECANPQDAVIIKLLFSSGVQGKNLSEIRNIKKEHVRQAIENDNVLTVFEDNGDRRTVVLDEETIELLVQAMEQEEYYKRNGQVEDSSYGTQIDLVDNDYVIRTSKTRTDEANRPVDKMVVYRRIKMLSDMLGIPHLNAKNISRSGIIYEASQKESLEKDDYMKICAKFNLANWYPVQKYCNAETIDKLYNNRIHI